MSELLLAAVAAVLAGWLALPATPWAATRYYRRGGHRA